MELIISKLLEELMTSATPMMDNLLLDQLPNALKAEIAMNSLLGMPLLDPLSSVLFSFGISLIVLNFLFKGFNIYIGWTDGDPDADPIGLLTNLVRALAVAAGFPVVYSWGASVVTDVTDQLINSVGLQSQMNSAFLITGIATAGIGTLIIYAIFYIQFFIVTFQLMGRGVELLILRLGVPIAAVGLLNSDKGVFGSISKIIVRNFITVVIQIVLLKLSFVLMMNLHPIWGVVVMTVSTKAPKMLSEFMIPYGGGSIVGAAYQVSGLVSRTFNTIKKSAGGAK